MIKQLTETQIVIDKKKFTNEHVKENRPILSTSINENRTKHKCTSSEKKKPYPFKIHAVIGITLSKLK